MLRKKAVSIVVLMIFCFAFPMGFASAEEYKLTVAANQSQVLTISAVERVAVANPDIADVLVVSSSEILVVGKGPGTTTLVVWAGGSRFSYQIEVGTNDSQIANDVKTILGYPDIRVSKVDKTVILEGSVNDQYQRTRAEKVASAYGEKVVNLLELTRPVQVKIEAKIIEISRSKTNNLGIKWGNSPGSAPGTFRIGQSPMADWSMTYPGSNQSGYNWNNALSDSKTFGKSWGSLGGYWDINAQIDNLVKSGSAKILSQPNMITLSGDKATIVVGGEIPIPVAIEGTSVTVEWKQYGIILEVSPEVNGEGLISSKIKAEVSSIDWSSDHKIGLSDNFQIPPVITRKAESSIALSSGQTMAIGGLISSNTTKDVTKIPGLANLPIIGKLFKSTSFSRDETELIILITPTIVNPADYVPGMTSDMKDATKENPWGVKKDGGSN